MCAYAYARNEPPRDPREPYPFTTNNKIHNTLSPMVKKCTVSGKDNL